MRQLLFVTVFFFYLMPSTLCSNLGCLYRPLMEKDIKFQPLATECPRNEVCYKAEGRYGTHIALSSSGCMTHKVCGQERDVSYRGVVYTLSYSCCNRAYCNACGGLFANTFVIIIIVTLVTVAEVVGR
ncbi:protein Bouncer [Syngnathus typhle]|uniref:protein Bouncer n=1 Tax=Syngnathus typhle TaxID=161592 RepID=UPI002A6A5B04|nr:protein Bouncer [Syngnathus typhle]